MSGDTGARPLDGADAGRGHRPRLRRCIRILLLTGTALLAAGSTAFALGSPGDGPSVTAHDAGPPQSRDDMVRQWRTLLSRHGRQLPDTSAMTAAEIREAWTDDRTRYAEPDDGMARNVCESGPRRLFDPGCW